MELIKQLVFFVRFYRDNLLSLIKSALQPSHLINFDFVLIIELRLIDHLELSDLAIQ